MNKAARNPRITIFFVPSFLAIVAMLVLIAGCGRRDAQATSAEEKDAAEARAMSVRTEPAQLRTIAETINGLGTCEALLDKTAVLAPAIEGKVQKILIKPGEQVKAGQPIVQLDTQLAQANLEEKVSTRDGLKASLRLLKSLPRPEEQKSYHLAIDEAQVALRKAEAALDRLRPLREKNDIPQQQLFEAELALKQAQIAKEKAENQLELALLGPRAEAVAEADAHIITAEAGITLAQAQLNSLTLRSPIDGVADRIACKLGQTLAAGAPIADVVDIRQLNVIVWLPALEAANIRLGQQARVYSCDSRPSREGSSACKTIPGEVIFVGQTVDPQTGNLPLRILIENPEKLFTLGQTVAAEIIIGEKADALAAPVEAVDDLGAGPQLSVVRERKSAVLHPRLGMRDKHWVEIEGTDLKPGEPVIVEGGYNLPEGTKVEAATESNENGRNEIDPPAGAATAP